MNARDFCKWCLVAVLATVGMLLGSHPIAAQLDPVVDPVAGLEEGVDVLTRGPVHEAFAETITFDPQPGIVVEKQAPEPIEELPPEQKPEGDNVDWIPGYWAWDDERSDFLWVSGIWRSLPPGRQWVPGYWAASGQGAQWTSGYWADAEASEIDYLPEPPETVEAGPNIDAPSADHSWVPGCWIWQQNRYAWRPGFWAPAHADWMWIPAHYVWTPRGYVFVDGYYDYSVARRGVLFAPVYFHPGIYSRPGFAYSPATVINPAVFLNHLFLRPNYGHYYFGDYYGANYASIGFSPWFMFFSSRSGYDPFYAHQRWHHRNDAQWRQRLEAEFAHRRDHEDARPPRTWAAQRNLKPRDVTGADQSLAVALSLDEVGKSKDIPVRLQPVPKEQRQQIGQRGQDVQRFRQERQKLEGEAADSRAGQEVKPTRVKQGRTPIRTQPAERLGKDQAPPKAVRAPQPDPKVAPKPRQPRQAPGAGRAPSDAACHTACHTARSTTRAHQGRVPGKASTSSTGRGTQRAGRRAAHGRIEGSAPGGRKEEARDLMIWA
jgi:hypothetical protein